MRQQPDVSLQQTGDLRRRARGAMIERGRSCAWALDRYRRFMKLRRHLGQRLRVGIAFLLSGCRYHTELTPLVTYIERPPTCAAAVTMYERADDVQRPYVRLAEITLWYPADMRSAPEGEHQALQEKAATVGANGLILGHPRAQLQSRNAKTVAIFVPADSARATSVCAQAPAGS